MQRLYVTQFYVQLFVVILLEDVEMRINMTLLCLLQLQISREAYVHKLTAVYVSKLCVFYVNLPS